MNKILRLSLIALLAVFCGGGVFAEVYKTLTFPDDNKDNNKAGSYTATWTAKMGTDSWSISNFNNNSWNNDWAYIKAGRKNTASVASIKTDFAIDMPVNYVAITIDKVTASDINSIKLNVCNDEACTDIAETVTAGTIATGELKLEVATPKANCYYQIVIDCAAGSSNGFFQISKVVYDATISGPVKQNAGLKFSENNISYKKGETFTAPTFTKATTADVTFTSDNTDVATVDATGNISLAGGLGTAIITATSKENTEYYAGTTTCTIEVYEVNTYKKATAVVNGGKYLLVAQRDGKTQYAMPIASNKTYGYLNVSTIEGLVDEIDVKKKYNDEFVVTAVEGGYTIQDCYDRYLAQAGTYASFQIVETPAAWTIEPQADGTFKISMNGYYIQWGQGTFTTFGLYTEAQANAVMPMLYASEDTPTGITNVVSSDAANENAPIYNLAGQRVNKNAKGILIQNGKKFVNK